MTAADQPDLFGEYDAREAERAAWDAWMASGHTCPCCGETEPNGWLLTNNHGIKPDGTLHGFPIGQHPNYGSRCGAQYTVSNHIYYDVTQWRDGALERSAARGRELHLDVDAIIAEAELHRPSRREWLPPHHKFVSLDCEDCGHPMGSHEYRQAKQMWHCVKGCDCGKTHANMIVGPACPMWRRGKYLEEAASTECGCDPGQHDQTICRCGHRIVDHRKHIALGPCNRCDCRTISRTPHSSEVAS